MAAAAHLVLDREDRGAGARIDNVLEPELVVANAFGDQVVLLQILEWAGEVGEVDRDVVAIVVRDVGPLTEHELLPSTNVDKRGGPATIFDAAGAPKTRAEQPLSMRGLRHSSLERKKRPRRKPMAEFLAR